MSARFPLSCHSLIASMIRVVPVLVEPWNATICDGPGMYHRVAFIGVSSVLWAGAAVAEPQPMSGKSLSEIVPGASVQIDTPLGTKLPIKFTSNGTISGEAGGLAWFLGSATDRGRWWVADDKLLQMVQVVRR
jgi:hypothetical protein